MLHILNNLQILIKSMVDCRSAQLWLP